MPWCSSESPGSASGLGSTSRPSRRGQAGPDPRRHDGAGVAAGSSSSAATGPPWSMAGATHRRNMGHFGDDFLQRAADQSIASIAANDPAESVYLVNFTDADGSTLAPDGPLCAAFQRRRPAPGRRILVPGRLHHKGHEPDPQRRRPLLGRRPTPGVRWDPDGGLTICLQPKPPSGDGKPNSPPTSAADPWFVILRMYRPHPEVIDAEWECPGISQGGVISRGTDPANPAHQDRRLRAAGQRARKTGERDDRDRPHSRTCNAHTRCTASRTERSPSTTCGATASPKWPCSAAPPRRTPFADFYNSTGVDDPGHTVRRPGQRQDRPGAPGPRRLS